MQARFSLQGELLAPDVDLPTHLGLHHHGEEAEVIMGPREDWAAFDNHGKGPLVNALDLLLQVMAYCIHSGSQLSVSPHSLTFQSVARTCQFSPFPLMLLRYEPCSPLSAQSPCLPTLSAMPCHSIPLAAATLIPLAQLRP